MDRVLSGELMGLASDLRVLMRLALGTKGGSNHAERLEGFYGSQAEDYDDFRERLLPGRQLLFERLAKIEQQAGTLGETWVDLGGGTGRCLELMGASIQRFKKVYVVDLSPSLLKVARERVKKHGWTHVEVVEADATTFRPAEPAQLVTCSYSMTMMPDWYAVMDNARRMLEPGGRFAATDFYVSRRFVEPGMRKHSWLSRTFWPTWFGLDNVWLSPDHLPYLKRLFETESLDETMSPIPYMLGRVPCYVFTGRVPKTEHYSGNC